MQNLFKKMQLALWNNKGESYVDSGVKMLIAIVIGALLLTGIYAITRDVVLENVETQISDFFDQTPTLNGGGSGGNGGGNGSGGSNEPPVLAANFADNSWADIAFACQNNEVPDTWVVGDIKTTTIKGKEVEIVIIGKNHDPYADGSGRAPLTFMTKQVVEKRAMNSTKTNVGGWEGSEMYTYLNNDMLNNLEFKDNIKSVSKTTTVGGGSSTTGRSNNKLFLLAASEVFARLDSPYSYEGSRYDYFEDESNLKNTAKKYDTDGNFSNWWFRSPGFSDNECFCYTGGSGRGSLYADNVNIGISFAFCF